MIWSPCQSSVAIVASTSMESPSTSMTSLSRHHGITVESLSRRCGVAQPSLWSRLAVNMESLSITFVGSDNNNNNNTTTVLLLLFFWFHVSIDSSMMIRIIIRVIVVLLPNKKTKKNIWSHTRHFEMATRHRPAMDITRLKGSPRSV